MDSFGAHNCRDNDLAKLKGAHPWEVFASEACLNEASSVIDDHYFSGVEVGFHLVQTLLDGRHFKYY